MGGFDSMMQEGSYGMDAFVPNQSQMRESRDDAMDRAMEALGIPNTRNFTLAPQSQDVTTGVKNTDGPEATGTEQRQDPLRRIHEFLARLRGAQPEEVKQPIGALHPLSDLPDATYGKAPNAAIPNAYRGALQDMREPGALPGYPSGPLDNEWTTRQISSGGAPDNRLSAGTYSDFDGTSRDSSAPQSSATTGNPIEEAFTLLRARAPQQAVDDPSGKIVVAAQSLHDSSRATLPANGSTRPDSSEGSAAQTFHTTRYQPRVLGDEYQRRSSEIKPEPMSRERTEAENKRFWLETGLRMMSNASRPGASALGSFGEAGTQALRSSDDAINRRLSGDADSVRRQRENLRSEFGIRAGDEQRGLAGERIEGLEDYRGTTNNLRERRIESLDQHRGETREEAQRHHEANETLGQERNALGQDRNAISRERNARLGARGPAERSTALTRNVGFMVKAGIATDANEAYRMLQTTKNKSEAAAIIDMTSRLRNSGAYQSRDGLQRAQRDATELVRSVRDTGGERNVGNDTGAGSAPKSYTVKGKTFTDSDIDATAKKYGITADQVKQRLGIQ